MGISPILFHFDSETALEILKGYRASTNAEFARKDFLQSVIDLYSAFHSGPALIETRSVFSMVAEHFA